ncbi:phosphotransferase [Thermodesulfobacteriota bacterium]
MDRTEQITKEHALEQKSNRKAVNPGDIPISYEAITSEWLTYILCKGHPEARVIAHRLDVPDEGTTNRRRIFLTYNPAGNAANLPASVFCKASHQLTNRLVLANCGLIQGEVAFYNKFRPLLDIEVPTCFLATYSPRTYNSIIMLDDLVRHGAEFCTHNTEMTRARAESQMALLARLHGRFYESTSLKESGLISFEKNIFSDDWFGMEVCCNNGFLAAEEVIPARLFRRNAEIWPATLKSAELHGTLPRTFTHTDTHLRNWYIAPNGQMGLCDWQVSSRGHWGRDVAYTISTALTVENRRAWEKELLLFYLDRLQEAGGPAIAFADAWNYYRQHLFTSLAWWTLLIVPSSGTSDEPPPDFQPRDAMFAFIGRMATAIDDLDALSSFD